MGIKRTGMCKGMGLISQLFFFFCHSKIQSQPSEEEEGLQVVLLPVFIKLHVLNLLEQKRNSSLHTLPKTFSIL